MAPTEVLKLLSKTSFATPVSGSNVALNPAIELAATIGDGNALLIWRANGQLVTKYTERNQKINGDQMERGR